MKVVKYNPRLRSYTPSTFNTFVDRFFDEAFRSTKETESDFIPRMDVAETPGLIEFSGAIPGMKKEDFSIEFQDGALTISGERKFEKEDSDKNYHTIETQYGMFSRTFYLPENVDGDKIAAEYVDGILKVTIPKDEKAVRKNNIEVK